MRSGTRIRTGTAGWRIAKDHRDRFPADGTMLERYASVFSCVEINSSFHKQHRPATYARWAASVPAAFRFSLKIPKEITHKRRLVNCMELLAAFLDESGRLGDKLGPYIVQLAPSHVFDDDAASFLKLFRTAYAGDIACEPRHMSWSSAQALQMLQDARITRIGADPAPFDGAHTSLPFGGFTYYRWHGAPRTYYSQYDEERLNEFAAQARNAGGPAAWCIFDNTAMDGATGNALTFQALTR